MKTSHSFRIWILLTPILIDLASCSPSIPAPAIRDFWFVPIVRGIQPYRGYGILETGRTDYFFVHQSPQVLWGKMETAPWKEIGVTFLAERAFGYGYVDVSIEEADKEDSRPDSENWSKVIIHRRISLPPSQARTGTNKATLDQLDLVRKRINDDHTFSRQDRLLVKECLRSSDGFLQVMAGLTLEISLKKGLTKRADFNASIEEATELAEKDWGSILWTTYSETLIPMQPESKELREESHDLKIALLPEDSLIVQEKELVSRELAQRDVGSRVLAAQPLVQKRGLNPADLRWIELQVAFQIARSKGDEKELWESVKRIVDFRATHSAR